MANDSKGPPGGIERRRYPNAVPGDPQYDRRAPGSGGRRSTDWGSWTRPLPDAAEVAAIAAREAPVAPKILVVYESEAARAAHRQALSELQVQILDARSSAEALRLAREHDFALFIVDSRMPEMDGYELLGHLRGERRSEATPAILTIPTADNRRQGYRAGAVDCLVEREIDPEILRQKARTFLTMHKLRMGLLGRIQRLEAEKHQLETKLQALQLQRRDEEPAPDMTPNPSGAG